MTYNYIFRKSTTVFFAVTVGLYAVLALYWTITISLISGLLLGACAIIPIAIVGWFILSLVLYLRAKKRGDDDLPDLKHRMKTAVILLIFLAALIAALIAFFAYAIGHM